tara:strand:+ start:18132 stop:19931 length:1800 start_codon:yes stop_codon:yes gene_type:complete
MCGFIGSVSYSNNDFDKIKNCNDLILCRGPDEYKELNINSNDFFGLSNLFLQFIFNRLSIIDLSEKASQPMISKKYKSILLFNGEIYNHRELRKELEKEGEKFYSNHSDSEVALIGISKYGPDYINKLNGQFAISFIDVSKSTVYLFRDRLGQKPLFYFFNDNDVKFSSNLISLSKLSKDKKLDEKQIINYLNLGVIPSPFTIFDNIYKVEPGTFITFKLNEQKVEHNIKKYWKIEDKISNKEFNQEEFHNIFSDSVNSRMESDVDVASFLSGGIDSTSIIKMLVENNYNVNSFSVGYGKDKYDESYWFNQVANKYNLNHNTQILTGRELDKDIDSAIDSFDEPYSDPSIVPSYTLSKLISKNYKVAISGDGGDELLGGYKRISFSLGRKKYLNNLKYLNNVYPKYLGTGNKFLLNSNAFNESYASFFEDRNLLKLLGENNPENRFNDFIPDVEDDYKKAIITDYKFFLSEMMLLKIDRTSMASSLEVRSPFVDHRLVEYILGSSYEYFDMKNPKKPIKDYLSKDFDIDFLERKKMGFVFNIEDWIYNNIGKIEDVINNGKTINNMNRGIIDKLSIKKSRINSHRIWKMYILEKYLDRV